MATETANSGEAASSANFTFTAEDGHELYVHAWLPEGEVQAVVSTRFE